MRSSAWLFLPLLLAACAPPMPETAAPEAGTTTAAAPLMKVDPAELEALRQAASKRLPGVTVDAIRPTPLPGLFELQAGMNFGYISADGRYLIEGDLADLVSGARLTDDRRREARKNLLAAIPADQSIEFAPEGTPKYTVTVFTDVDCGYCRKLHGEMAQYNAQGIAVRYLFFPRSGPDTESFYKAEEVWCSADRRAALTLAKQGSPIGTDKSCENPIMGHYKLAAELGLRGTPAILLPDGEMVPGYQPAAALARILAEHAVARGATAAPQG